MIRNLEDEDERIDFDPPNQDDEIEEENDFDLDALLAEATAATEEERRLKAARKRLIHISKHEHASKEDERLQLLAEIRRLEEKRVWLSIGNVALFKTQTCAMCNSKHSTLVGWFTEQKHVSDPNARRLLAGRMIESADERREDHTEVTECCSDCIESLFAINAATRSE